MYEITKIDDRVTNIALTRGDTFFLQLTLTRDGEPYTPAEGETIRFAMKRRYSDPDSKALIKYVPIGTLLLEIEPDDTKPFTMGKDHVYEIAHIDEEGHEETFMKGTFTITEEVV